MLAAAITYSSPAALPMLARPVRAGFPSPADDFIEQAIDLQSLLIANRAATFLVRVAGDSMLLAQLFDGDIAVVDRSLSPADGDVVVVDVDGERSFKVWSRRGHRVRLAFANPRFPEFELSPDAVVEVWGVVSGSVSPRRRSASALTQTDGSGDRLTAARMSVAGLVQTKGLARRLCSAM